MHFPLIDLNSPTDLAFQWGWLLATLANAVVSLLIVVVFILGITVRLPGARRDLDAVERANAEADDAARDAEGAA